AGTSPGDEHDRLVINGHANLAGTLAVTLVDSFTPLDGDTFDILDFSSVSGDFDLLNLPGGFDWNWDVSTGVLSVGSVVGGLAGDYDGNGVVDAADYTIFQDNLGGDSAVLSGNGSGAATVVQADYLRWVANFGSSAAGSDSSGAAVPEPSSLALILLAGSLGLVRRRVR
ncbi:MAG: PEP-CTERM sorting domain-containing protein, partial [Mariniblastus sp.]|nr:PEP-CTERM sorting domain-containing protein [Mariniblastus sp.]